MSHDDQEVNYKANPSLFERIAFCEERRQLYAITTVRSSEKGLFGVYLSPDNGETKRSMAIRYIERGSDGYFKFSPKQTAEGSWVSLASIPPRDINWLWKPRLKRGAVNLLAGLGGVGKDILACTLAAVASTGCKWPDGTPGTGIGLRVGYLTTEDDAEDTIAPRLLAAGADLERVRVWRGNKKPSTSDLDELDLLVVSPMLSLMDSKRRKDDEQQVREFLEAWQSTGCTIVGNIHLNKKADLAAAQRVLGASAWITFVRSVHLIAADKHDPELRHFLPLKANLQPAGTAGLTFRVRHVGPYDQSILACDFTTSQADPDDILRANAGDSAADKSIGEWIVDFLTDCGGEELASVIYEAAALEGNKHDSVKRAAGRLRKNGRLDIYKELKFQGKTRWRLVTDH